MKKILFIIVILSICSISYAQTPIRSFTIKFGASSYEANPIPYRLYYVQCGDIWCENYRYNKNLIFIGDGYNYYTVNNIDDTISMSFDMRDGYVITKVEASGSVFYFMHMTEYPKYIVFNCNKIKFIDKSTIIWGTTTKESWVIDTIINGKTYNSTNFIEKWTPMSEYKIYDNAIRIADSQTGMYFSTKSP